jgi:hypothetical protein
MKHILNKYDDVAETLKSVLLSIIVTAAIIGLAPMVIVLQAASF